MTKCARIKLACTLLFLCSSSAIALAQQPKSGVEAGVAFGAANFDGIVDGFPPAGKTVFGAVRISAGAPIRRVRVSAETEVSFSGNARGRRREQITNVVVYQEKRRDVWWSMLGGLQAWEPHGVGSVHVVAGLTYVKPVVAASGSSGRIGTDLSYQSTWAATVGTDLFLRWGRVSAGPTFRWFGYLGNPSPYEIGKPTRAVVLGLGSSYRF